jgi:hypothetical protein
MQRSSGNSVTENGQQGGGYAGGIVSVLDGIVNLTNSIVAGNSAMSYADILGSYNDNGGNLASNNSSGTSTIGIALAPLGFYGGPTQSMLPLPGSPAICAGNKTLAVDANLNPLTTDQRGFPLGASSYCASGTVDAGAVQTDYTSVQFTNDDSGYSVLLNQAVTPAPVVSVTESGQNIGGVPVTLTFSGTGTATGLGPVTTAGGTGATFSSLSVNAAGNDTLSATLQVTPTYSLTTSLDADLYIEGISTSLAATPSFLSFTYGTTTPSISVVLSPLTVTGVTPANFTASIDGATGLTVTAVSNNTFTIAGVSATLSAGSHSIVIEFQGTDTYASSSVTIPVTVNQAAPVVTWSAPAGVVYGTPLSATQLNATASYNGTAVAGTFIYNPAAGAVLNVGTNQTLSATFVPTDATDYTSPVATTSITVTQATTITTLNAITGTVTPSESITLVAQVQSTSQAAVTGEVSLRRHHSAGHGSGYGRVGNSCHFARLRS